MVDWRMTSRGPLVKKAFSVFFRFTLEIPFQIRDSAIPSAIPRSRKLTGTIVVSPSQRDQFSFNPLPEAMHETATGGLNLAQLLLSWCFHTRARQGQDDKTNVEPACIPIMPFTPGPTCLVARHNRNVQVQQICLVIVLSCSGVKTPLV